MDLIKLAEALDAAADLIDEQAVRLSQVDATARTEKLAALRARIEPLLRDPDAEISDEILEKVAADASLEGLLGGLVSVEGSGSSSLGSAVPATPQAQKTAKEKTEPQTAEQEKIAELAQKANDAWASFCREGL